MGWDPIKDIKKAIGSVTKSFAKEVLDDVLGYDIPKPVTPMAAATPGQILPGVAQAEPVELSVATTSYLETQDYLALQRQKALVKGMAASGIISEKQAGQMAMPPTKQPTNFRIIAIIMIVLWGLTRWK